MLLRETCHNCVLHLLLLSYLVRIFNLGCFVSTLPCVCVCVFRERQREEEERDEPGSVISRDPVFPQTQSSPLLLKLSVPFLLPSPLILS